MHFLMLETKKSRKSPSYRCAEARWNIVTSGAFGHVVGLAAEVWGDDCNDCDFWFSEKFAVAKNVMFYFYTLNYSLSSVHLIMARLFIKIKILTLFSCASRCRNSKRSITSSTSCQRGFGHGRVSVANGNINCFTAIKRWSGRN